MILHATHYPAFALFAAGQIATGDIDPTYPVLREVYTQQALPQSVSLWRTLLYVTWYHLGTSERVWRRLPEAGSLPDLKHLGWLPAAGVERRAFRGVHGYELARAHVDAVLRASGGDLERWVHELCSPGGEAGWKRVREAWSELPWGGPWSSYKFADLLAHVHGMPITANDIGIGGGGSTAGPIPGMQMLTGRPWQECAGDVGLQRALLAAARASGVPLSGLDQLETTLCDFSSLARGRYYLGHDIDQQMAQFAAVEDAAFWEARGRVLDPRYLGERRGWFGVRPELKSFYARTGKVRFEA